MIEKNLVKRGQIWVEKITGKPIKIMRKHRKNYWQTDNDHKIHEGTLQKYYFLLTK